MAFAQQQQAGIGPWICLHLMDNLYYYHLHRFLCSVSTAERMNGRSKSETPAEFIPSPTFKGSVSGYVYKKGPKGVPKNCERQATPLITANCMLSKDRLHCRLTHAFCPFGTPSLPNQSAPTTPGLGYYLDNAREVSLQVFRDSRNSTTSFSGTFARRLHVN